MGNKKQLNFGPDHIGKKLSNRKPRFDWKRLDQEQEQFLGEVLERTARDFLEEQSSWAQTRGMQIVRNLRLVGYKFTYVRTELAAESIQRELES